MRRVMNDEGSKKRIEIRRRYKNNFVNWRDGIEYHIIAAKDESNMI